MWQVLLAAAIAGSGYFAKQLLHKNDDESTNCSPKNLDLPDVEASTLDEDTSSIFRFSSTSYGSENSRKKLVRGGGIRSNRGNHVKKIGPAKKTGDRLVDDQRKSGKKFTVCLKKRRTGRNASAKCDSFDVKDKSSFGWGVGVGIMYMMSAGKAEINRLNTAVDETAKVVQELKIQISKRKSSRNSKVERTSNQNWIDNDNDMKWNQSVLKKSSMENNNDTEAYSFPATDEGGDASSMITEERHQEVSEMDQLEAELESELLKLHVSNPEDVDLELNQSGGVTPYELDQKLCHLLIEQQESQIVDLASELQRTNSKLLEKESELQALKDCVKRLTEFSLTCPSDEEREGHVDEAQNKSMNGNGRSVVGIKRAMDFD